MMSWGSGGCQGWSVPLVWRMSPPLPLFMSHNRQCQGPSAPVDLSRVWKKTWATRSKFPVNKKLELPCPAGKPHMQNESVRSDIGQMQDPRSRQQRRDKGGGGPGLWVWAWLTTPLSWHSSSFPKTCMCTHMNCDSSTYWELRILLA